EVKNVLPAPVVKPAGRLNSPTRRVVLAAIVLLAIVACGLGITEWTGFTRFFRGPSQYEVTMRVDDLNITLRCCAARENETPEQFAERFREKASRNDFSDFMI